MRRVLALSALVAAACIDFEGARAAWCAQNPAACGDAGETTVPDDGGPGEPDGGAADSGAPDAATPDGGAPGDAGPKPDGGASTDGGRSLGALRELGSAGGRMTHGTLTLDVELGHPTPRAVMRAGTLTLSGAATVQR